jgi:hypothetical protein
MSWWAITKFVEVTVALWFGAIALMVVVRIVTGAIPLDGMLKHDPRSAGFDFHRLQLVAVTLMMAGGYLILAVQRGHAPSLPDVTPPFLLAVAGSHLTYLGNKLALSGLFGGVKTSW